MNGFCEKIIKFLYKGVTGTRRVRMILTPLFALFFLCILLLAIFISLYMDRIFGFYRFVSEPYGIAVSMPFLIAGSSLWIWCAWKFFQAKGTPAPINPPPILVTDGPYAYARNPMMTGVFIILSGIGILSGSVSLTFIVTPIFVFISILEFKYIEEPELEKRFGEEYCEYKKGTPIIIPRFR